MRPPADSRRQAGRTKDPESRVYPCHTPLNSGLLGAGSGEATHNEETLPPTTHTTHTRGRLGRVCAVHSRPRLPKAQASGFFSASAFSLRRLSSFLFSLDFHFAQNVVAFFLTILFFSNGHKRFFLDGFCSAHSRVITGRLPLSPGWHFVGTHPSLPPGSQNCAKELCRSVDFFFLFFLPRFHLSSALYATSRDPGLHSSSSVALSAKSITCHPLPPHNIADRLLAGIELARLITSLRP